MKKTRMAILSMVLVLGVALTGCGSSDSDSDDANSDVLRIGSTVAPVSLDPAQTAAASDYFYLWLIYDRLIETDPRTLELRPGLATKWEWNTDNTELALTLREGIKFHDGSDLTAEVVKQNLDRFIELGKLNPLTTVSGVRVDAPLEVTLVLSKPNAFLPGQLADAAGTIVSGESLATNAEDVSANPVGSGPYKYVSQLPGESMELERNDDYWNDERGFYENYRFQFFGNVVSMVQALNSGSIDAADRILSADLEMLRSNDKLVAHSDLSLATRNTSFNTSNPAVADERVRQAFSYALDRAELAQVAEDGFGEPNNQPFPSTYDFYDPEQTQSVTSDLDRAKKLMEEAGVTSVDLKCVTYPGVGFESVGPFMIEQVKEIGINMTLDVKPLAEAISVFYTRESSEYDCLLSSWIGQMTPYSTYYGLFGEDSFFRAGSAGLIDQNLFPQLAQAYDVDEQVRIGHEITSEALQTASSVTMWSRPLNFAHTNQVSGYSGGLLTPDLATLKPAS